ncbi:MAG: hypothetical protein WDM92_14220 [Caulobacteraceae bacterium]
MRRRAGGQGGAAVQEVVVTGSRIARRGLHLQQPDRHGQRGVVREHRQRGARSHPEQAAAVRRRPEHDRRGQLRRRAADRDPHRRHLHGQPSRPRGRTATWCWSTATVSSR